MKSLFLICALSVPPALVPGPLHQPAYCDLFSMLVDYSWRRAEIRISERDRRTMILIGKDRIIEMALEAAGWEILSPPFYPSSTSLVLYLPPVSGNLEGVDRIVQGLVGYLIPGGFFIAQGFDFEDFLPNGVQDVERLIMRGFRNTQFTVRLNQRVYSVWQRKSHWMRRSA